MAHEIDEEGSKGGRRSAQPNTEQTQTHNAAKRVPCGGAPSHLLGRAQVITTGRRKMVPPKACGSGQASGGK